MAELVLIYRGCGSLGETSLPKKSAFLNKNVLTNALLLLISGVGRGTSEVDQREIDPRASGANGRTKQNNRGISDARKTT